MEISSGSEDGDDDYSSSDFDFGSSSFEGTDFSIRLLICSILECFCYPLRGIGKLHYVITMDLFVLHLTINNCLFYVLNRKRKILKINGIMDKASLL